MFGRMSLLAVAVTLTGAAAPPAGSQPGSPAACAAATQIRLSAQEASMEDDHADAVAAADRALALCPGDAGAPLIQLWVKTPALFLTPEPGRRAAVEALKPHYDRLLSQMPNTRTSGVYAGLVGEYEAARLAAEVYPQGLGAHRIHRETNAPAALVDWLQEGWVASTAANNAKPYRDRLAALKASANRLDPKGDLLDRAVKIAREHSSRARPLEPANSSGPTKAAPAYGLYLYSLAPPLPATGDDSVATYKPLAEFLRAEVPGAAGSDNPRAALVMWLDDLWARSLVTTAYAPYTTAARDFYNRQPSDTLKLAFEKIACSHAQIAASVGKPIQPFLYNWIAPAEAGECIVDLGSWRQPA